MAVEMWPCSMSATGLPREAMARLSPVLGRWVSLSTYFSEVVAGDYTSPASPDEFQDDYLIERSGSTVPRGELLRSTWGYSEDTLTRTVDMHIASLREKLEENPKRPELIVTVAGVGYKFVGSRDL